MDIGRAFNYPRVDQEWLSKMGWFALWALLVVTSPACVGYSIECSRRVADGEEECLPSWDGRFGEYWMDGLRYLVAMFAYAIPMYILMGIMFAVGIAGGVAVGDGNGEAVAPLMGMAINVVSFLYQIGICFVLPALVVSLIRDNSFGAGFAFGRMLETIKRDFGQYCLCAVLVYVGQMLGGLGVLACGIGIFFTIPYFTLVCAHLVGQLARNESHGVCD